MQLPFSCKQLFFCCFFILTTALPIFFFELIIHNRKKIPSNNFFTTSATTTSFFLFTFPPSIFLQFTRLAADALGSLVTSKQKCTYILTYSIYRKYSVNIDSKKVVSIHIYFLEVVRLGQVKFSQFQNNESIIGDRPQWCFTILPETELGK